jgi:hypothetical protein
MIGEWLIRQIRKVENQMVQNNAPRSGIPFYNNTAVSVYRISNGFLIVSESSQKMDSTIVYCKDVGEIGDHIVMLHTRDAMGIPSHVSIGANGPTYPSSAYAASQAVLAKNKF